MRTKHARIIREAIMMARKEDCPDYLWAITVATQFQYRVFQETILRDCRRDLLREYKKR